VATVLNRSLIFSLTSVSARIINFLTIALILRIIGPEGFGQYQYHLSLINSATLLGLLGTNALLFREFSVSTRNACIWLYHGLLVRCAGLVTAYALAFTFALLLKLPVQIPLLIALCLVLFTETTLQLSSAWWKARRKPWLDFLQTTARSLLILGFVTLSLHWFPSPGGIALGYLLGGGVVLGTILYQWHRALAIGRKHSFHWPHLAKPASTLIFLELMGGLYADLPVFALGYSGNFEVVGIFAVYFKFLTPFVLLNTSYDQSFQVEFNRLVRHNAPIRDYFFRGIRNQIILGLGTGALAWACAFPLLRGLGNLPSINWMIVLVFSCYPLLTGFCAMLDNCLIASRREKPLLLSHFLGISVAAILLFTLPDLDPQKAAAVGLTALFVKLLVSSWNVYHYIFKSHTS
jgi:O-antigen/teichoic acid export membrane protein